MKSMTKLLIGMLVFAGCNLKQPDHQTKEISGHHHPGDRHGRHGMVLFGSQNHYLAHIPTFSRPHNEQLIMKVSLSRADGSSLQVSFAEGTFSVNPTGTFSLDNLATGDLVDFAGNIHRGSFEQGGHVIIPDITFHVEKVLVARNLPGNVQPLEGARKYFVIGEGGDRYLVNYITADQDIQQILSLSAFEAEVTEGFASDRATLIHIESEDLLAADSRASFQRPRAGGAPPSSGTLAIARQLWCVVGPGFFNPCR